MPHQCVRCGKLYDDGSKELLQGCTCGGRFFFYVKPKHIEEAKEIAETLTQEDKEQIEKDVMEIVGPSLEEDDSPVILDLESIRVAEPGKYELDLVRLFEKKPIILKLGEGKYIIDIARSMSKKKKAK
ncbi:hypothetical protein HY643_00335 [Candidatus Woesearchaeota archaeon]|nr:hypothetical protein [Candidatus Woesearchaeota archaeon]